MATHMDGVGLSNAVAWARGHRSPQPRGLRSAGAKAYSGACTGAPQAVG